MDTGFKRVKALNTDTEKYKNMLTVMNASVFNRYNEFVTNCRIVLRNLDETDKKRLSLFNDRLNELEVRYDIIKLKQDIIDVLYVKKNII